MLSWPENLSDQPDVYPMKFKLIIRPMLGRHLDSMSIMEQYLENECQDLEYTIVRPPRLLDMHIIGRARVEDWLISFSMLSSREGSESSRERLLLSR